jgi:acetoin utilization protein AcuC
MKHDSLFVYSPDFLTYKFNAHHPFNQLRVEMTYDLLKALGALSDQQVMKPRQASVEELKLIHHDAYIQAVQKASQGLLSKDEGLNFGLGTEDTPIFPNMHEASAYLVGGTLTAVDLVMSGSTRHAISLGGGLHHGFCGKASGFCIYNDSAVAIRYLQQKYNARVLYIDTDAHHGDGVQVAFYDDPKICTFSIHETGRYLFPGTGTINERGYGNGYGYSFNLPLDAYTEDESFLYTYETAIREIAEFFKPDVILTQNGADAHYHDPLTHLYTTMETYKHIPKIAHELAHKYCNGRWIAVGGGGYDIWRVVPRAWSLIWLEMTGFTLKEDLLPKNWVDKWSKRAQHPLCTTWSDPPNLYKKVPRKKEIEEKNSRTLQNLLFPIRGTERNKNVT